jgi:deoxyribodipyrimidine photo-lyase
MRYRTSLFIFHQDLRLDDNTALIEAVQASDNVVPCVIAEDTRGVRVGDGGDHTARFTYDALVDLNEQLESYGSALHVYVGTAREVVHRLIGEHAVDAAFFNREYTRSALEWERSLEKACREHGVDVSAWDDRLLHAPGTIVKDDREPYSVFTAYYRRAEQHPVREPRALPGGVLAKVPGAQSLDAIRAAWSIPNQTAKTVRGGRKEALRILGNIDAFARYRGERDIPSISGTTMLSPYLRSGCCSAREVLRAVRDHLGDGHELTRQLHWRDFFSHIAFHFPHVFDGPFHRRYSALTWDDDPAPFDAWRHGTTGFPIVDAGMRELEETGNLHNRVRMIVSSFLVKDIHIDWRMGERHFAELLTDYDPAVNNGNWQWAASTGCDAQPYFRIFNPWLQQKKFDPDAVYIKHWVPELRGVTPVDIHRLWKNPADAPDYPNPIVDHQSEARSAKDFYRKVRPGN